MVRLVVIEALVANLGFGRIDDGIATRLLGATSFTAPVSVDVVSIVADFALRRVDYAITTTVLAVGAACVAVLDITIITDLACINYAITAAILDADVLECRAPLTGTAHPP
jgi:hypothetical protein